MRGIRRRLGKRQVKAAPATAEVLGHALKNLPDTLRSRRESRAARARIRRGVAPLGFALRRSGLVALRVSDVERRVLLHIGRSKTDQEGEGADIPVPNGRGLLPVAALDACRRSRAAIG